MVTYLLAIGRAGTPHRRYLTDRSWSPDRRAARRFFDRVSMRVVQIEEARRQRLRVRVVRLRGRGER